ncbi:hypothetical protein EB796_018671 [Bugula neritina]|uniref:Dynein heavy chain AAA module D4 domain-containing protein n=1 Tax=Bugula neritina TaxID=10212 RepID=A0A7J7J9X2_BUGNE|nr:hypothetical protein EB796_018671 [Bugula neritina]
MSKPVLFTDFLDIDSAGTTSSANDLPTPKNMRLYDINNICCNITEDITTDPGDIVTDPGDITTYSCDITTYSCDITTYSCDITTYSCDITTYSCDITTYSCDITTYSCDITTYPGDITTYSCDITTDIIADPQMIFVLIWSFPYILLKSMRVYRPTSDLEKITNVLEEYHMRQHLSVTQAKKFVFFEEAVHHICRAVRVFRQPSRHMLMVGLDGTGKATVIGLACYIAGCKLFRLALSRGYNMQDFREDLKRLFRMAGVQGKSVVFLLTDSDIVKVSTVSSHSY